MTVWHFLACFSSHLAHMILPVSVTSLSAAVAVVARKQPSASATAWRRSIAEVLAQLAALLGAVPARFGAGGNVLVVWGLLAGRGAVVAALRAALQHGAGEWALAGA